MTRVIRVLLIGPLPPPVGGATVLFEQLVRDLSKRDDVQIKVINTARQNRNLIANLIRGGSCLLQLIWLITRVDVVSFHAAIGGAFLLGPVVWLVCKVFRRKSMLRRFAGRFDWQFEQLTPVLRWIIGHTVLDMDVILLETKHLVAYFRRITPKPVVWFSNSRPLPSDLDSVAPRPSGEGARKFVFVGHVKPSKGIREIIEASQHIEEDIQIDVYGPLHDGVTENEFSGQRVVYRGMLPPEEVIETLGQYDVLLLPTYHHGEGYPGAILEGYCAGIPVITTDWNAIPEIVDQDSGILVKPGDAEALREAMLRLIRSPEEYARLRKGARRKAPDFSSRIWSDKFVEFASNLAEGIVPGCETASRKPQA